MRKIYFNFVKPGMTVGYPVYNSRGELLINGGIVLTRRVIEKLSQHGVPALYIEDDLFKDVEIKDVLDLRTRVEAVNLVRSVFSRNYAPKISSDDTDSFKGVVSKMMRQLLKNRAIMVDLVDIRCLDDYLFSHCVNVCVLSLVTAIHLGYDETTLSILGMGAILHDMGKTMIPKDILDKPGKLTDEEYEIVKMHPLHGYELLRNSKPPVNNLSALLSLQHHERFNGEGYPAGLSKEEIHNLSQIVGMADMFDAMTSDRVYRRGYLPGEVWEMLAAGGDYIFKYELIQAFLYNVAPYSSGSVVRLGSNEIGIVIETRKGLPLHPRLKIISDSNGIFLKKPIFIELWERPELSIKKVFSCEEVDELKLLLTE